MDTYKCATCGKVLPVTDFYSEDTIRGHTKRCKPCLKLYKQEYNKKHPEKREAWRKAYRATHAANERRRRTEHPETVKEINHRMYLLHGEKYRRIVSEYREQYPERERAHNVFRSAVRGGKLILPSVCECCGEEGRIQGHHEDYSKPLDVVWLCGRCHGDYHRGKYDTGNVCDFMSSVILKEE